MARVQLPPGCYGIDLPGGGRYSGKPGSVVDVSDEHARAINKSWYSATGVMSAEQQYAIGTRTARVCSCNPLRRWNSWSITCPRCGAETSLES